MPRQGSPKATAAPLAGPLARQVHAAFPAAPPTPAGPTVTALEDTYHRVSLPKHQCLTEIGASVSH